MVYRSTPHGGMFNVHWHCLLFNVQRYESSSGPQWSSIPIGSIHMSSITSPHVLLGYCIVSFCQSQSSSSFFSELSLIFVEKEWLPHLHLFARPWSSTCWMENWCLAFIQVIHEVPLKRINFFLLCCKKKRKLKTKSNYNVCLWCEVISFKSRH